MVTETEGNAADMGKEESRSKSERGGGRNSIQVRKRGHAELSRGKKRNRSSSEE